MTEESPYERPYIRVTPSTDELTSDASGLLSSLHSLRERDDSDGLLDALLTSSVAPTIEFLLLSEGPDAPVEVYYSASDGLETLEQRLSEIYPSTFKFEQVSVDLEKKLVTPIEFTPDAFARQLQQGMLRVTDQSIIRTVPPALKPGPNSEGVATGDSSSSASVSEASESEEEAVAAGDLEETDGRWQHLPSEAGNVRVAPPENRPDGPITALEEPTATTSGTILARPAATHVTPCVVEWSGLAERSKDWMTALNTAPETADASSSPTDGITGASLRAVLQWLTDATVPTAFQVVFRRRRDWSADASLREDRLKSGADTLTQKVLAEFLGPIERDYEKLPVEVERRIELLRAKNPKRTFDANIRAVAVQPQSPRTRTPDVSIQDAESSIRPLLTALDPLAGAYYSLEGKILKDKKGLPWQTSSAATTSWRAFLEQDITGLDDQSRLHRLFSARRPGMVLSASALASLTIVPSGESLPPDTFRSTRSQQATETPLTRPDPDVLSYFREGMAVGYALDENGDQESVCTRVPLETLTTHYLRAAATGAGKSIAVLNDLLSLQATNPGQVVLVDPKGDGMCDAYLQAHYRQHGNLDGVYYFDIPTQLPGFSFFDIRPALAAGRAREDAVQDKAEHFHEILGMLLGKEVHEQAFVANEILTFLIKALFDSEYGQDAYCLHDLSEAILDFSRDGVLPELSTANQHLETALLQYADDDSHHVQSSISAVQNRVNKIIEHDHLYEIFINSPAWNEEREEYADPVFDFRAFLDEDAVLLFDIGELRTSSQRAITVLLLSNIWEAVRTRGEQSSVRDKQTHLVIEEAAPIAATSLVYDDILPQGRAFGLCLGLVMQYPEQVRDRSRRAYREVLNNIQTKLIGTINHDEELAASLAYETVDTLEFRNRLHRLPAGEWIAELPSPAFGVSAPEPFSLQPLPVPPGHPESQSPLTERELRDFEEHAYSSVCRRTQDHYCHDPSLSSEAAYSEPAGTESVESTPTLFDSTIAHPDTTPDERGNPRLQPHPEVDDSTVESTGSVAFGTDAGDEADHSVERGIGLDDATLDELELTRGEVKFLDTVLDAMNDSLPDYSLVESMRTLEERFTDLDIEKLERRGYLESGRVNRRKYYTVLPAGRKLLDRTLTAEPGVGDLGEKTPHKVGVKLLADWLCDQPSVVRVECYYEHEEGFIFDVAAFDDDDTIVFVGEVELVSNNAKAVADDYDKLSSLDVPAIWAVRNKTEAVDIVETLISQGRLDLSLTTSITRTFTTLQEAIDALDAAGFAQLESFYTLESGDSP